MSASESLLEARRGLMAAVAVMGVRLELAATVALTIAVGAVFWFVGGAAVGGPGYLDPWIYTALFQNFAYLYHAFGFTYYTSRLPWIIPGRLATSAFSPIGGYFALHIVFILSAGAALYVLLRRFFGRGAALVGYATLLANAIFYGANANDYPDGAQITHLLLALSTGLLATNASRPVPWMVASGFFAAAAVGTNLWAAFFVAAALVTYGFVVSSREDFLRQFLRDAIAFVGGAFLLLVAVGSYAKAYGGEFLFFMPSVRTATALNASQYRLQGYSWVLREPRLLAFAFVVLAGAVVSRRRLAGWRCDAGVRLTVGLTVSLAALTAIQAVWEYAGNGIAVFDIPYYTSVFDVLLVPTSGAAVGLLLRDVTGPMRTWIVAAAAGAAVLPLLLVYGHGTPDPVGRTAFAVTAALVVVLIAAGAASRSAPRALMRYTAVAAGIVLLVFTLNFSAAGSSTTSVAVSTSGVGYGPRFATSHLLSQLIGFMRRSGLQSSAPDAVPAGFWFDASDQMTESVQSAYLYGWTAVGFDLPRVTAGMQKLLAQRGTRTLVLLCAKRQCDAAPAALARAGYSPSLRSEQRLHWGRYSLWAQAFDLRGWEVPSYRAVQTPLQSAAAAQGRTVASWRFDRATIPGWSGAVIAAARAAVGREFETTNRRWDYELVSPELTFQPGTYLVILAGRVARGGLDLGVLDVGANVWMGQSYFWSGQRWRPSARMALEVRATRETKVRIVLANWVFQAESSRWQVEDMVVKRW
jgi:Dolichyl-phosphate-mannose-protein mannosyltransferase